MKITLDAPVHIPTPVYEESKFVAALKAYNTILTIACIAEDFESLKFNMKFLTKRNPTVSEYFHFGFGGSHFWTKQIIDGKISTKCCILITE